jgi:beta-phosphoglucomutase-like phosphatase (HAD superfamily)
VLQGLKITDCFDAISDGSSVENTKPAPDLFLHAARSLGIPPRSCVVVEDAESGIEAALAAGMVAVGIGPEERVGKAHYRVDCIADIDVSRIMDDERSAP